jgi:hypothetical protein
MERTGGEPDVVGQDRVTGELIFFDCSEQTPKGRTSVCYDREALESRKVSSPENSAIDMAAEMGIQILTGRNTEHFKCSVSLIQRHRVGLERPKVFEASGARFFAIVDSVVSSPIITARSLTLESGRFEDLSGFKIAQRFCFRLRSSSLSEPHGRWEIAVWIHFFKSSEMPF